MLAAASTKVDEFVPNIFGLKKDQINQAALLSDRVPEQEVQSPKVKPKLNAKRGYHRAKNLTVLGIKQLKDVGEPYLKQMRKQNPEFLPAEALIDIKLEGKIDYVPSVKEVPKNVINVDRNKREELDLIYN